MKLEYAGFSPLRPGRIHLFCTYCKRKYSNMPRTEYDPDKAVLAHILCEKCSQGAKDFAPDYLDEDGNWVNWDPKYESDF